MYNKNEAGAPPPPENEGRANNQRRVDMQHLMARAAELFGASIKDKLKEKAKKLAQTKSIKAQRWESSIRPLSGGAGRSCPSPTASTG